MSLWYIIVLFFYNILIIEIMILQKYKTTKQFKKKSCLHYDELSIIFGDTAAFGANQHPSTKSPSTNDDDDGVEHSSQPKKKALVSVDTKKKNQEKTFKWHLLRL